jgi:hypothetical protein
LEKIIPSYHRLSVFLGNCSAVVNQAEFLRSIKTLKRNQPAQLPDLGLTEAQPFLASAEDPTTAAYLSVTQNLARHQAMTAAEPAVKSAAAGCEANIGKAASIRHFVGQFRLLSLALDAYRLAPAPTTCRWSSAAPASSGRFRHPSSLTPSSVLQVAHGERRRFARA